ncbi:MAG TPA: histidinol-phosphate transaminase [Spongiibacteraceae bacterium]|nr:histidinol-phosphate transaminase [Spongiibacteraceae bacterium]HCS27689.1 histidinol-phosphate transaminase [Spongiibacteraceae bacterium]
MSCDYIALANAGVQALSPYQAGKPIEELQRELGLKNIVKLASNENPLGPSELAVAACRKAADGIYLYPDSSGFELKKKLAEKYSVTPAQITLGNGSNDVLDLIARAFLEPGKSAVFSAHAFVVYPIAVQACGARAIVTPAKAWGHDLDAMLAAIEDDTRVIFIANPNNPTGTWVDKTSLEHFLGAVPEDVIVVLDEAYTEYVTEAEFPNGLDYLERYPNVVVTRTFSKAYGLAGLRVGYSISSPAVCDLLNRVRAPFNVSTLALAAAEASLNDEAYLQESRRVNAAGLKQLGAGLDTLGLEWIPSVGNFIAFKVPADAAQVYQGLLRAGVIVRPVGVYAMPGFLRVSVGLESENRRFLEALPPVLDALASGAPA